MLIGLPLMGLGFILLSRVNSLLTLYLVYIIFITFGSSLGAFTTVNAAVANWFVKKRTRAFGIVMSGVAVGGAVFLPLLGWWITTYGWRSAAMAAGLLITTTGVPLSLLMRHRPEQYGYLPDGADPIDQGETASADNQDTASVGVEQEIGPIQCLKTSAFWFLGGSLALRAMVTTGVTIHFVSMMVDRGLSLTAASALLGSVALLSLVGRLGMGWLGDMVDKRYLLAVAMGVMALTMMGLSQAQSMPLVLANLVVYAAAYGGCIVLPLALQADYFGRHAYATIRGLLNTVQTAGMLVGPIFAGLIFDVTGNYNVAFAGFAVASALSGVLLIGLRRPKVPTTQHVGMSFIHG